MLMRPGSAGPRTSFMSLMQWKRLPRALKIGKHFDGVLTEDAQATADTDSSIRQQVRQSDNRTKLRMFFAGSTSRGFRPRPRPGPRRRLGG